MKKKLGALILAVFLAAPSFADDGERVPNAIFVDFGATLLSILAGGFGVALGYERGITDYLSVMGSAAYIGISTEVTTPKTEIFCIGGGAHVRFYPLRSSVKRLFIDAGAGYSYIAITFEDKADAHMIDINALIGWKFTFSNGFFVEPGVGYTYPLKELTLPIGAATIYNKRGPRFCLGTGWAF